MSQLNGISRPDYMYQDATRNIKIAVFIDGGVHHTEAGMRQDRIVRLALKNDGWKVVVIMNEDLLDDTMMDLYRTEIDAYLADERLENATVQSQNLRVLSLNWRTVCVNFVGMS